MSRPKRSNAGNKMDRLLNEEEEDEFYVSAYGGFQEEVNDNDYMSESSQGDSTDSDIDNSSAEGTDAELLSEGSDAEDRRRKSTIVTAAVKKPAKSKKPEYLESVKKTLKESKPKVQTPIIQPIVFDSPKLRQRTLAASEYSKKTREESAIKKSAILAEIAQRKNVPEVRRLTQAELLAEAKITEEINKRSLAQYQRMEIEKKKSRTKKSYEDGPRIRYHSFAVPNLADQPEAYCVKINPEEGKEPEAVPAVLNPNLKASRILISFSDATAFQASSLASNPARKRVKICPITGLKANYCDPLTNTPYANLAAFRVLRKLYEQHIATKIPGVKLLKSYRKGELVL